MPCKDKALNNTIKNIQKLKHESYKEKIKTQESKAQEEFGRQKEAIAQNFPYIELRNAQPGWKNGKPQVHVGTVFYHITYNSLEVGYSLWLGEYQKTSQSIDLNASHDDQLRTLGNQIDEIQGVKEERMLIFIVLLVSIFTGLTYLFKDEIGEYLDKLDGSKQPELQQVEFKGYSK